MIFEIGRDGDGESEMVVAEALENLELKKLERSFFRAIRRIAAAHGPQLFLAEIRGFCRAPLLHTPRPCPQLLVPPPHRLYTSSTLVL